MNTEEVSSCSSWILKCCTYINHHSDAQTSKWAKNIRRELTPHFICSLFKVLTGDSCLLSSFLSVSALSTSVTHPASTLWIVSSSGSETTNISLSILPELHLFFCSHFSLRCRLLPPSLLSPSLTINTSVCSLSLSLSGLQLTLVPLCS